MPKEYTAVTKVSDEYQETDLAIGLNKISAKIRDAMGGANSGINDMGVYCKILETEDFARSIAHKRLAGKNVMYGEYLGKDDTIKAVLGHINYNYSSRKETLTISFTDRDAVVASQMLDSVTMQLQATITQSRRKVIDAAIENTEKEQERAALKYQNAQNEYSSFVDSHKDVTSKEVSEKEKALEREVTLAYKYYEETIKQHTRQIALKQRSYMSFAVIQANTVPQKTNDHLIGYVICFVIIALSLTKAWFLYRERKAKGFNIDFGDLFSPWSITIGVWSIVLLLLHISDDLLDPLSEQFYLDIFLWCFISCCTSFCVFQLLESNPNAHQSRQIDINMTLFNVFYVIAMIITPLYIYQIYKLVALFDSKDLMLNLRELAIYGEGYGFLNYTYVINEVLLLIALWKYPKIPLWQLLTIIVACLLYAIGNMEKITVFLVFISSVFVMYEKGVVKVRTIAIGGLTLLILFYVFNLARSGEDSDYSKNESLIDFIGMYVLAAPVAYGKLHQTISDQFGSDTLWSIYHYLKSFIDVKETHQSFQEFVFVPIGTNVYTVMRPYYTDFGHIGVAFYAYLYGLLTGIAYRLMRNGQAFGICLYTYLVYTLVLQFFDEFITATLPLIMQMLILLMLMTQKKFRFTLHLSKLKDDKD